MNQSNPCPFKIDTALYLKPGILMLDKPRRYYTWSPILCDAEMKARHFNYSYPPKKRKIIMYI